MDKSSAIRLLKTAEPRLRQYGVKHARLFGSVVRGDHRPHSDVDVAVVFGDGITPDRHAVLNVYGVLTDLFGKVDVVIEPASAIEVQRSIERESASVF